MILAQHANARKINLSSTGAKKPSAVQTQSAFITVAQNINFAGQTLSTPSPPKPSPNAEPVAGELSEDDDVALCGGRLAEVEARLVRDDHQRIPDQRLVLLNI